MTLHVSQPWEYRLLAWAQEARHSHTPQLGVEADRFLLDAAYHHCDLVTRTHSRTFFMASALLPFAKRQAARALYAFCRITDDIVDSQGDAWSRHSRLMEWQRRISAPHPPLSDAVALAWADARTRFNIPNGYANQLIEGVARDLYQTRYETFEQLAEYSYGVASTVGLMAMHIIGFEGEDALPYAVKLGVALQITNILRDVAEDRRAGRVYLPQQELKAFGLSDEDLTIGSVDDRWRAFMRFQIERNRQLYAESQPGIAMLDRSGRLAIAAAADLYQSILEDIEQHDYNVFDRRAHVTTMGKLSRLPGIWWRSQTVRTH